MSNLVARMRESRKSSVEVEGHKFIIIRPTIQQMIDHKVAGYSHLDLSGEYVIDWPGVKECDIIRGGSTDELPFDSDVWKEWLADHPEWWVDIGTAIINAFNDFSDAKEEAAKN